MDDAIGWAGFCVSGQCIPWSGYTVQVNTSLIKPVPVGAWLKVKCTIVKVERRKVFLQASLTDPGPTSEKLEPDVSDSTEEVVEVTHARADGLFVLNRGVLD